MMKKLLVIDSNSLINRAFYGVRFLSSRSGTPTNAIYGFFMTLMKLFDDYNPDYVCAAFDLKAPTFRHKMYKEYKAGRKPMPDALREQIPIAKDILRAMGICLLEKEGFEADDIIGTVSAVCEKNGIECLIATGDKDDLQLASDRTKVLLTVTKQGNTETDCVDGAAVFERYGVTPSEFIDVKALMGDSSDNIPGVYGIGEKTAVSIIAKAHSIENLYENIEKFGISAKNIEKLLADKDTAFLSKTLATIDKNVPIELDFECLKKNDYSKKDGLYEKLRSLDLNKLIERMGVQKSEQTVEIDFLKDTEAEFINSFSEMQNLAEKIIKKGETACYFELSEKKLKMAAFAVDNYAAAVEINDQTRETVLGILKNPDIKKYTVNIKDMYVYYDVRGVVYDAAIAAYLVNPSHTSYGISDLAYEYLGYEDRGEKQISLFEDETAPAKKALAIMPIVKLTKEKLIKNGQESLYYDVELPLCEVLADMQKEGVLIDKERLLEFSEKIGTRIAELVDSIYDAAGGEFNINSPKQLAEVLFDRLGLKPLKKTKSGYSTNAEVLEKLQDKHPIIPLILEYRTLSKLKSTYCDGLMSVINPETGRIHSVFNQMTTVTGRISSTEPNMQNIPTRTELGSYMRRMFVAKEGCILEDADYSQIELRVLAHIANDTNMIEAFQKGEDIHRVTAAQVLGISPDEVTKDQRSSAKAVNFGIVYGIGEYSLSQDLKISVKQAKEYINNYLNKYNGVHEYMEKIKDIARKNGYVETLMRRRRYIPEITSSNFNTRAFGERVALNTPIQGTAADIIKLAMVRIYRRLKDEGFSSKLILQVHDELIIETYPEEKQKVREILKTEMENAMKLSVPLVVDMSEGKSWYDAK
ncbi:MAG TPA: DNA polymerase I [Clostridiales bacterium]|nr:DNA polymerase I [Clostridiales bacterium]